MNCFEFRKHRSTLINTDFLQAMGKAMDLVMQSLHSQASLFPVCIKIIWSVCLRLRFPVSARCRP